MKRAPRSLWTALHVVFLAAAGSVSAGDKSTDGAAPDKTPETSEAVKKLVEQLGDPSFTRRRIANSKLIKLGLTAKPALEAALKHPDLEVRIEARRLLVHAIQSDFERRLAAFIRDVNDEQQHGLPGWKGFREIAGGSRGARRLFAEMVRAENPLLDSIANNSTGDQVVKRIQKLQRNGYNPYGRANHPAPTLATLLYAASQKSKSNDRNVASQMNSFLSYGTNISTFSTSNHSVVLTKLLKHWILRETQDSNQKHYGMTIAMKYNLPEEGLKLAREVLTNQSSSYVAQNAIMAIGKFGKKKDAQLLVPHLSNARVCHTWSNRQIKKDPIKIQIRDVALCMVIRMCGEDPRAFGFRLLIDSPETVYTIYSLGFVSEEERSKAIKKWNDYADQKKIPYKGKVSVTSSKKGNGGGSTVTSGGARAPVAKKKIAKKKAAKKTDQSKKKTDAKKVEAKKAKQATGRSQATQKASPKKESPKEAANKR